MLQCFLAGFRECSPFPTNLPMKQLISLSSGLVAGDKVNCYCAFDIGQDAMTMAVGKTFGDLSLKHLDKVSSIAAVNHSVKFMKETVVLTAFVQ